MATSGSPGEASDGLGSQTPNSPSRPTVDVARRLAVRCAVTRRLGMTRLPIPVHVGSEPLDHWDDIEARQRQFAEEAAPWLQKHRRPAGASPTLDWAALGFEPRWVGFDTADCAVALQPSIFSGHGANEFDRFRRGAESRGETALVISPVGDLEDKPRSVLFQHDDSVSIGQSYTSVSSRPIMPVAAPSGPTFARSLQQAGMTPT